MSELSPSDYKDIWIHQSKLMWSRLQTLTVVNFAVYAAWWKTELNEILILGIIFTILIFGAMKRDADYLKWLKTNDKIPDPKGIGGIVVAGVTCLTIILLNVLLATNVIHLERLPRETNNTTEQEITAIKEGMIRVEEKVQSILVEQKKEIKVQLELDERFASLGVEEQSEAEVEPVD